MSKTKKAISPNGQQNGPAAEAAPESLDKVRDILFGGQMRAVEARLQGLESRLMRGQEALRNDLLKQLGGLEATVQKEVQALLDRLQAERTRRAEELKGLGAELKEAVKGLERRHLKLEEASGMADAELREGILQQSKALTAEIGKLGDRLSTDLARSVGELRDEKAGRAALAAMFTDLAARLGDVRGAKGTARG
jgi:hypothetical protein